MKAAALEEETNQETAKEKAKRLLKERGLEKKSLPIRVMESELFDWNSTARMILLVIALGYRTNEDAYTPADMPDEMKADLLGWCYFAQWRIAQRVGKTEKHIQRVISAMEKMSIIIIEEWTDSNNAKHNRYKIVEDMIDTNQRPSHRRDTKRPRRSGVKRSANKGSFTSENQPFDRSGKDNSYDE